MRLRTLLRFSTPWLTAHSWAEKTDITYPVELAGKEYTARLYKLAVTGYEGRTNTLNLFDLDTIDESIVHDGIAFDKTAIDKNLTLFLYPDDSDEAGRRLRVYQQYPVSYTHLDVYKRQGYRTVFWHRLTGFGSVTLKRVLSGCGRMRKALRLVRRSNQGSCDSTVKRWQYDVDIVGSLLAIDLWKVKTTG